MHGEPTGFFSLRQPPEKPSHVSATSHGSTLTTARHGVPAGRTCRKNMIEQTIHTRTQHNTTHLARAWQTTQPAVALLVAFDHAVATHGRSARCRAGARRRHADDGATRLVRLRQSARQPRRVQQDAVEPERRLRSAARAKLDTRRFCTRVQQVNAWYFHTLPLSSREKSIHIIF